MKAAVPHAPPQAHSPSTAGDAALPFPSPVPFVQHIGCRLLRFDRGEATVELDLQPHLTNSFGVGHGGVMMTMLDVVMAMAARSADPGGHGVVTVEMKTTFMRPGESRLVTHGRLRHRTATLAFCDAELFDVHQRLCASASGTFKFVRGVARPRHPAQADAGLPSDTVSDDPTR